METRKWILGDGSQEVKVGDIEVFCPGEDGVGSVHLCTDDDFSKFPKGSVARRVVGLDGPGLVVGPNVPLEEFLKGNEDPPVSCLLP